MLQLLHCQDYIHKSTETCQAQQAPADVPGAALDWSLQTAQLKASEVPESRNDD